jgi:tetratricopeptide (TPR) repeat protein
MEEALFSLLSPVHFRPQFHILRRTETAPPMAKKKQLKEIPATVSPPEYWQAKLRCPGFLSILLIISTVLVYLPLVGNGFVNYDDPDYVTSNSHVQGGLTWTNIVWAFTTGHASNWHPLTWISHMVDWQLFGSHPGPHHLVNVAFHIANTLLLFLVFRQMTGALWRSALVAALFALHPLHVESVAWISERKDVLSAFFFMLTLLSYGKYVGAGQRTEDRGQKSEVGGQKSGVGTPSSIIHPPSSRFYFLSLLMFALGLMSKPMLVTLPFVLLLLDYWPLQRIQLSAPRSQRPILGRLLVEKIPFLALSVGSCAVTFLVQKHGGAVSTSVDFAARLANALVSYARYVIKAIWPAKLSILYPHPGHWSALTVALSGGLIVVISVIVFMRKRAWLSVGWLWFLGTLVPVIGVVQVGIQSMADRYTYIPLIGLCIMFSWGLAELIQTRAASAAARDEKGGDIVAGRPAFVLGIGFALAACALLTFIQIHHWRNSETLFRHAVAVTKDNYLAYNNLGFYLSGQGKIDEALENYQMSVQINPNYEDALNNLGYALAGQKKFNDSLPYYEAALRVRPNHTEVHNNLGNALSELGRIDEAIRHYRIVLEQKPDHADAHNNLGIALAMQGKLDEAIPHFMDAIRFKTDYASAHSNLGNAFAAQHKFEEAIGEYRESLRLKPDDAQAHNNLGNALAEQGNLDEAIKEYTKALQLNADNPEAHFNLGVTLVRKGNPQEAATHFREALRLKPDYGEAQRELSKLDQHPRI